MAILRDAFLPTAVSPAGDVDERVDRAAFARLYEAHAPGVHRFLRDLLGDAPLAADATQETFIRAYRKLGALQEGVRVVPWLFGIARNVSLELRKSRHRTRRIFVEGTDAHDTEGVRRGPEAELLGREAVGIVAKALECLSCDRRAVLLMRLDHGLSYDEIASAMGWSLAKVKVEIFRARDVLRATLEDYKRGGSR